MNCNKINLPEKINWKNFNIEKWDCFFTYLTNAENNKWQVCSMLTSSIHTRICTMNKVEEYLGLNNQLQRFDAQGSKRSGIEWKTLCEYESSSHKYSPSATDKKTNFTSFFVIYFWKYEKTQQNRLHPA